MSIIEKIVHLKTDVGYLMLLRACYGLLIKPIHYIIAMHFGEGYDLIKEYAEKLTAMKRRKLEIESLMLDEPAL